MSSMKTRSQVLLLSCLPLLALTGIVIKGRPHPAQLHRSRPLGTQLSRLGIKGNHSMTLSVNGYKAAGAGTSADNANFSLAPSNDPNGNQYLTNGQAGTALRYAYFQQFGGGNYWIIGATLNLASQGGPSAVGDYYAGGSGITAASFPLTGWVVSGGVAPAPTFTASNPQLIKGGAAVTIALVSAVLASGQSAPANQQFSIWEGSTNVVSSFSPGTLPYLIPGTGITITGSVSSVNGQSSITLQAASSATLANFAGATFLANVGQGPTLTSGVFDIVVVLVAPAGVTATPQAGLGVVINSTNTAAQPSGTTYNLLESTTSGGEGATPIASGITLPYTRQETTAGQKYFILQAQNGSATANSSEVSALAYNQQSGGSNTATATASVPAPGAVTGLTATLMDTGTAPNIALAFVAAASGQAATGFNARRGTTSGGESATPLNSSPLVASATGFTDTTAAYAQDYYYVVDSINSGGTVTSAEVHIKTDTSKPSLTVTAGNGVNTLNITNGGGTLGVLIERCLHGGTLAPLITLPNAATSYPDTTAVNGTAYDYQVFDLD